MSRLSQLKKELKKKSSHSFANNQLRSYQERYLGDSFIGVSVPRQRQIVKSYLDLSFKDLKQLLESSIHEFKFSALLIIVAQYERVEDWLSKQGIVNFYLANSRLIDNWDLVDVSVYKILGDFLSQKKISKRLPLFWSKHKFENARFLLLALASSNNFWERRLAVVSTYAFIKQGSNKEIFLLTKHLLNDPEDLIQKALGWMLREAAKKNDSQTVKDFLYQHHRKLARLTLRYAIERFSTTERKKYLAL